MRLEPTSTKGSGLPVMTAVLGIAAAGTITFLPAGKPVAHAGEGVAKVLKQIRTEAVRRNSDPDGRPLPLAMHWNRGTKPSGFGPPYQIQLIREGHHLLPWFQFPTPGQDFGGGYYSEDYLKPAYLECARWKLPICFVGTQWEFLLSKVEFPGGPYPWKKLPPEKNPNVIGPDGKIEPKRGVSPFGPVGPWKEVGAAWVKSPMMEKFQAWYPDPPLVIFLSNNEAGKLRWAKNGGIEASKRYVDRYGTGRDDSFKRKVLGDGYIERYRAMLASMRENLVKPAWRENAIFVGYGNFGPPHLGRWDGWDVYSCHAPGRIAWQPYAWDGASPSYYTHNWNPSTDFRVWSPQVEAMNWVFMQREILRDRPDFWFEISVWDGDDKKWRFYQERGQTWTPERYEGFVQFGMWLLTPRAVREFRGYLDTTSRVGKFYRAIVRAVDRVYSDPVLARFWRAGQLVPNRAHKHPYQARLPEEYADDDRWYLLDTNLDPPWPWNTETELPVFSLARVLGEKGRREWLVYAHSPLFDRRDVEIRIPEGTAVTVDVSLSGSFYHVRESTGELMRVGR